ncbi:MAG: hypothetical protein WB439_13230 [Acidobacteriaceae bacterium]
MRRFALTCCAVLLAALPLATLPLHAQHFSTHPCTGNDNGGDSSFLSRLLGGSDQVCEVRSTTFSLVNGHLNVNGMNGGIDVIGEDRQDIALEARVTARGGSQSDAQSLLHQISIETGATVEAHGPHSAMGHNWSVSYKLLVPHRLAADFHTMNGGLSLNALNGDIQAETTNGGVDFDNLGGNVHLSTVNGGIHAHLSGNTWQGSGLSAKTTNGGISVDAAPNYSAHVVASTVNGGIDVAGQSGTRHHSIDTNIGHGGPTLDFETVNGGVSIR